MKIKIIAISKDKFDYISDGVIDYVSRLRKYADVDILNLKEELIKSQGIDDVIEKEGEKILAKLNKDYFNVALHRMGKEKTSFEFAKLLEDVRDFKGGKICFIIGGPLGLSQKVLGEVNLTLSLSRLTFTHQMTRLILLEQIYRGFEILAGTQYDK
ncbi:23S rRNA (pseudouridine(1915)-N(3))-methyltransferase RlmH [Candidatus Falkowbacteria bacterium]|nr:23S rRNA (pseudouridine(1915)-N(3))-methyltransferase RlmH [Candidatus Falkowbacteria bacterium]